MVRGNNLTVVFNTSSQGKQLWKPVLTQLRHCSTCTCNKNIVFRRKYGSKLLDSRLWVYLKPCELQCNTHMRMAVSSFHLCSHEKREKKKKKAATIVWFFGYIRIELSVVFMAYSPQHLEPGWGLEYKDFRPHISCLSCGVLKCVPAFKETCLETSLMPGEEEIKGNVKIKVLFYKMACSFFWVMTLLSWANTTVGLLTWGCRHAD